MRDAAHGHAAHDLGIDLRAAVVAEPVFHDLRPAEIGIDANQQQMEFEREAGIHVHAAVFVRQRAAGRHLIDVLGGESRLETFRHAVIIAVGDIDEIGPGALVLRRVAVANRAVFIDRALARNAEIVRADRGQFVLELLRRVERRATQHDRHAASRPACRSAMN